MIQLARRLGAEAYVAAGNIVVAVVIGLGAFRLLPVRSLGVSVPAALLMAMLVASAAGLALRLAWGERLTRITGIVLLLAGMLAAAALTLGATLARRVVASSAGPSASLYLLIALLVLPYTVFYGAAILLWLRSRGSSR
jgi:hypothetical protein